MLSKLYRPLTAKIFAAACALASSFVTLKLFSKFLLPAEFGLFIVASQALSYLPYLDGGVRTASNVKLLSTGDDDVRRSILVFCQKFYSWFGIIAALVALTAMAVYWTTPNVRESQQPLSLFLVLGLTGATVVSAGAQAALLIGVGSQNSYFWIQGGCSLLNLAALSVMFKFGAGLWAFPLANISITLFMWPLSISLIKRRAPGLKIVDFHTSSEFWRQWKEIRADALNSFRSQLALLFLYSVDIIIVGMICGPAEAAVYALLIRILSIIRAFIQSLSEISWPLVAQEKTAGARWTLQLLRLNAWIYGAACGAIWITLLPFLRWYMGAEWTASQTLLSLLLIRFIIAGLHSPAGYFLLGRSEFKALARYNTRELIAAILFTMAFLRWGSLGVAAGFLLATPLATLFPIFAVYARMLSLKLPNVLTTVWTRAFAAFALSALIAWMAGFRAEGIWILPSAAVAAIIGASPALLEMRRGADPLSANKKEAPSG